MNKTYKNEKIKNQKVFKKEPAEIFSANSLETIRTNAIMKYKMLYPNDMRIFSIPLIFFTDSEFQFLIKKHGSENIKSILDHIIFIYIFRNNGLEFLLHFLESINADNEVIQYAINKYIDYVNAIDKLVSFGKRVENCKLPKVSDFVSDMVNWIMNFIYKYNIHQEYPTISAKAYDVITRLVGSDDTLSKAKIKTEKKLIELIQANLNLENIDTYEEAIKILRDKLYNTYKNILLNNKDNRIVYPITANTGLGKTYSLFKVIKDNAETLRKGKQVILYISPFTAVLHQAEKLIREFGIEDLVIVVTIQSLAHKAIRVFNNLIENVKHIKTVDDITLNTLADYKYTIHNFIPNEINNKIFNKEIKAIVIDEYHEIKSLPDYNNNIDNKQRFVNRFYELFVEGITELIHNKDIGQFISASVVLSPNYEKYILLSATHDITDIDPTLAFIIPRNLKHAKISIDYDISNSDESIKQNGISYLHNIANKNNTLIYVNDKLELNRLHKLLEEIYNKDKYEIIVLNSSISRQDLLLNRIKTNTNKKRIILATSILEAGFDSDIDYTVLYGIANIDRKELLQVIGRNRNKNIEVSLVLMPGFRYISTNMPYNDLEEKIKEIVNTIGIYYHIDNYKTILNDFEKVYHSIEKYLPNSSETIEAVKKPYMYLPNAFSKYYNFTNFDGFQLVESQRLYRKYSKNKKKFIKQEKNKHEELLNLFNFMKQFDYMYTIIPDEIINKYFNEVVYTSDLIVENKKAYDKNNAILSDNMIFKYSRSSNLKSVVTLAKDLTSICIALNRLKIYNMLTTHTVHNIVRFNKFNDKVFYDYDKNIYYYKTGKGYKVYPIALDSNTLEYLNANVKTIFNSDKNSRFTDYKDFEQALLNRNMKEIARLILNLRKDVEVLFASRILVIVKHKKSIYLLYNNIEKLNEIKSNDLNYFVYLNTLANKSKNEFLSLNQVFNTVNDKKATEKTKFKTIMDYINNIRNGKYNDDFITIFTTPVDPYDFWMDLDYIEMLVKRNSDITFLFKFVLDRKTDIDNSIINAFKYTEINKYMYFYHDYNENGLLNKIDTNIITGLLEFLFRFKIDECSYESIINNKLHIRKLVWIYDNILFGFSKYSQDLTEFFENT